MEELRNHLDYFTKDFVSFLETVIAENDYGQLFLCSKGELIGGGGGNC